MLLLRLAVQRGPPILTLGIHEARRIALEASGLGERFSQGAQGASQALTWLSAVQLDTISVVERAHHHILWARVPRYSPVLLGRLEAEPRQAIEYWSHAAAYLPIQDYRYCLPRMGRIAQRGHDWFKVDKRTVAKVLKAVESDGPLQVKDFEGPARTSQGWWDWKPAKQALEYLFHAGRLVSVTRKGFQKVYDLPERALPKDLDLSMPSPEEMAAYYLDVAQRSLGIFAPRDLAYGRKDGLEGLKAELDRRVKAGILAEVDLVGIDGPQRHYLAQDSLDRACSGAAKPRAFILSPFDPLLIDRARLRRLFGADYTIECYLPEAKRRFGYFALPLVYRSGAGEVTFAGLLDAKAERDASTLALKRLSVSGIAPKDRRSLVPALAAEIRRYAKFNNCDNIRLGLLEAEDPALGKSLAAALA